jgi:two-component system chemotaxis response regulator CheY
MSAYSGDRDQFQAAAQAGADLFIPKPFDDIFAVVTQLETLLGQEK